MSPDRASGFALIAVRVLFSSGLATLLLIVGVRAMETGGSRVRIGAAFFASPLLAYVLVHVALVPMGLAARRLRKVGGVAVLEAAERTSVRFDYALPFVAGWYVAFLLSVSLAVAFAGVIAAGFSRIGVTALCVAILLPIAAGLAVWLLTARRVRSGARDLVIDRAANVLHIPRRAGRAAETLPFGDIHAIEVGPHVDPTAPGAELSTDQNRLAAVIYTDQWKSPARARRVGAWSDRAPAEEFAAWVRKRISLSPGEPAREA